MTSASDLAAEADGLFDEDNFTAAASLYRIAALLEPPTGRLLYLLMESTRQQQYELLGSIVHAHPGSVAAKMQLAQFQLGRGGAKHAARICTELLQAGNLKAETELEIRLIRLRAAASRKAKPGKDVDSTLIEDVSRLWQADMRQDPRRCNFLLEILATVREPDTAPTLAVLAAEAWLPLEARHFLTAKVHELELLASARAVLTKPAAGAR